jgi:hypothetical protein
MRRSQSPIQWTAGPFCLRKSDQGMMLTTLLHLVLRLTLILLTWKIWCAPNSASKLQMGFNSAFEGLIKWQAHGKLYL